MSPNRLISGTEAERVRPFTFNRPGSPPATGPALAAIRLEEEIERRTRELTERIRDEARREGFDEGTAAAQVEMQAVTDALRHAVDQAAQSTDELLDDLARSALEVGLAIAEAVVGKVIVDDPTALFDPIRRALREVDGDDHVVLRLHPDDHRTLVRALSDESESNADISDLIDAVRVVDDRTIVRGACRVESATRIALDGLEQRLGAIRQAVSES